MNIPGKYAIKEGTTPETGSLMLKCSVCGTEFAVPPNEITAEIAGATVCDHPDCMKAAANAEASAQLAAVKPDPDKTSTMM